MPCLYLTWKWNRFWNVRKQATSNSLRVKYLTAMAWNECDSARLCREPEDFFEIIKLFLCRVRTQCENLATQKGSLELPSLAFYSRLPLNTDWRSSCASKGHAWVPICTVPACPDSSPGTGREGQGQEPSPAGEGGEDGQVPPQGGSCGWKDGRNHPSFPSASPCLWPQSLPCDRGVERVQSTLVCPRFWRHSSDWFW